MLWVEMLFLHRPSRNGALGKGWEQSVFGLENLKRISKSLVSDQGWDKSCKDIQALSRNLHFILRLRELWNGLGQGSERIISDFREHTEVTARSMTRYWKEG